MFSSTFHVISGEEGYMRQTPSIGNTVFFAVWGQSPEPYVFQMPTLLLCGRGADSVVQSTCCSCSGPEFGPSTCGGPQSLSLQFLHLSTYFYGYGVLPACMGVPSACSAPEGQKRASGPLALGIDSCKPPCGC